MDIGTPIKSHECYSIVNDKEWWGASCTCARVSFKGAFLVKKRTIEHSYIYDFGPRQCNQAVPASSPKSKRIKGANALALHVLMNEDFLR